jgi:penicillin-binding protein 1B
VLANGGFRAPLRAIRDVVAADGEPLQRYPLQVESVAPSAAVYLTTSALQAAVRWGTGRSLMEKVSPDWQLAGKTGTTDGGRDSWFAGYSGNMLGVVWLGRDDNKALTLSGASGALRIFGDAMKTLPLTPLQPLPSAEIEWHWIEPVTGLLAAADCLGAERVPFIRGTVLPEQGVCAATPGLRPAVNQPSLIEATESWFKRIFR